MSRWPVTLVLVPLLLAAGCSTDDGTTPVADEAVTDFASPVQEEGAAGTAGGDPDGEAAGGGDDAVAVELPGLPVGGTDAVFTEPSTQCVSVNVSGDPLPSGVAVTIADFVVPAQFTVAAGSCGLGLPGCLDGAELTADSGPCEVAVAWDGTGGPGTLAVGSARAECPTQARCDQAVATTTAAGLQDIALLVEPDGVDGDDKDPGDPGDPGDTGDGENPGDDATDDAADDTGRTDDGGSAAPLD